MRVACCVGPLFRVLDSVVVLVTWLMVCFIKTSYQSRLNESRPKYDHVPFPHCEQILCALSESGNTSRFHIQREPTFPPHDTTAKSSMSVVPHICKAYLELTIALLWIGHVAIAFAPSSSRGNAAFSITHHHHLSVSSRWASSPIGAEFEGPSPNGSTDIQSIPGRPSPPFLRFFFDDTIRLLNPKSMASYQVNRKQKYGPVFRTNIFFRPTLFCTDIESMQQLAAEESKAKLAAFFPPHHQKLFGKDAIVVVSGEQHQTLRGLIQSALSPAVLKQFQSLIDENVDAFMDALVQETRDDYVAVVPKLRAFFISLTLRLVLGTSEQEEEEGLEEALARDITIWSRGLVSAPLTFVPWSAAAKALRARSRIQQRLQAILNNNTKSSNGLLSKLMQARDDANHSLTAEAVIDNVLTLVFAGSDTTASAATSLLLRTANKKETTVAQVLHQFPPAPFSMRQIVDPKGISIGNWHIPSHYLVVYGIAGAVEGVTENSSTSGSTAPFGAGPRLCPGRFLATLELESFGRKLQTLQVSLEPGQNLEQRYTPGLFPKDGLRVRVGAV